MGYKKDTPPTVLTIPCGINQSGFWRIYWPAYQMQVMDKAYYNLSVSFLRTSSAYKAADVVQIQRVSKLDQASFLEKLCSIKKDLNFRLVYDVDDVIFREDIPDFNPGKYDKEKLNKEAAIRVMNLCDEIVVSTPFLREYYIQKGIKTPVTVIPNKIPYFWAGNYYNEKALLSLYRKHKHRPRILYAGGSSHINCKGEKGNDDFSHVIDMIIKTIKEFKWIFIGALPWELFPYNEAGEIEFYGFETLDNYPKRISVLQCSMMIVPLADNVFNHGRSNVKFLEAAAHGLPIACQDISPYKDCPIRFDTGEKMIDMIRKTLKSEDSFIEASRAARQIVDSEWLELDKNISLHEELFLYPYGDKRRVCINKINREKK